MGGAVGGGKGAEGCGIVIRVRGLQPSICCMCTVRVLTISPCALAEVT